jgi:2'-5' RNA ligase
MAETSEVTRDHWWWRPGWQTGRSYYTWHFTFPIQHRIHNVVAEYQETLSDLRHAVTPVPAAWLHLTLQGVGFADEVTDADAIAIAEAARARLAHHGQVTVGLGPAAMDPEAVYLPVNPVAGIYAVRDRIREAIGGVWAPEHVPEADKLLYPPHLTIGYVFVSDLPLAPLRETVDRQPHRLDEVQLDSVSLIRLNRDHEEYHWSVVAEVSLTHP